MTFGVAVKDESPRFVIPAEAGIQDLQDLLDPGLRRGDLGTFCMKGHPSRDT
jgi:hypothetical protein